MNFNKNDINYIITLFTLCICVKMLKDRKKIEINKLTEIIILFSIVITYNINNILSFCLFFVYILNNFSNI